MATILVTGGLGFIGSYVVRALLRAGHRVLVIDRHVEGNAADEVLDATERAGIDVVATTIPTAEELAALLRREGVEQVAHLASPLSVRTESDPGLAITEMVVPQLAVLDAAREAGVDRVVWASSVGVFGRASDYPDLPIPNDAPHAPLTVYGAAKSFLETVSAQYTRVHGLDTLGLRFPMVYGPGRQRGGGLLANRLVDAATMGEPIVVEGSGDRYDWMDVTDAARAVELALRAQSTEVSALTVGGEVATVGQVADIVCAWFPGGQRRDEPGTTELVADYDTSLALQEIGYAPATTLRQGLLAMVNAARRRAGLSLVA